MMTAGSMLIALGGIWVLQGVGTLGGSFMTGQATWAWIGAACVLFGLPLVVAGRRRSRSRNGS
jgi:hypothetical protein